jgi:hypothetical protein
MSVRTAQCGLSTSIEAKTLSAGPNARVPKGGLFTECTQVAALRCERKPQGYLAEGKHESTRAVAENDGQKKLAGLGSGGEIRGWQSVGRSEGDFAIKKRLQSLLGGSATSFLLGLPQPRIGRPRLNSTFQANKAICEPAFCEMDRQNTNHLYLTVISNNVLENI